MMTMVGTLEKASKKVALIRVKPAAVSSGCQCLFRVKTMARLSVSQRTRSHCVKLFRRHPASGLNIKLPSNCKKVKNERQ